jgi:hypothetical protein
VSLYAVEGLKVFDVAHGVVFHRSYPFAFTVANEAEHEAFVASVHGRDAKLDIAAS